MHIEVSQHFTLQREDRQESVANTLTAKLDSFREPFSIAPQTPTNNLCPSPPLSPPPAPPPPVSCFFIAPALPLPAPACPCFGGTGDAARPLQQQQKVGSAPKPLLGLLPVPRDKAGHFAARRAEEVPGSLLRRAASGRYWSGKGGRPHPRRCPQSHAWFVGWARCNVSLLTTPMWS